MGGGGGQRLCPRTSSAKPVAARQGQGRWWWFQLPKTNWAHVALYNKHTASKYTQTKVHKQTVSCEDEGTWASPRPQTASGGRAHPSPHTHEHHPAKSQAAIPTSPALASHPGFPPTHPCLPPVPPNSLSPRSPRTLRCRGPRAATFAASAAGCRQTAGNAQGPRVRVKARLKLLSTPPRVEQQCQGPAGVDLWVQHTGVAKRTAVCSENGGGGGFGKRPAAHN